MEIGMIEEMLGRSIENVKASLKYQEAALSRAEAVAVEARIGVEICTNKLVACEKALEEYLAFVEYRKKL